MCLLCLLCFFGWSTARCFFYSVKTVRVNIVLHWREREVGSQQHLQCPQHRWIALCVQERRRGGYIFHAASLTSEEVLCMFMAGNTVISKIGPSSKISPPPFFEWSCCFSLKTTVPPIYATVHQRSSTVQEEGLTNEGGHHLLLLHNQAHDKRDIEESYINIGLD